MKWLVTGGLGFVGTNLVDQLLAQGCEVIVFDNFTRVGAEHNLAHLRSRHKKVCVVRGDIRNRSDLKRLANNHAPFEAVAHIAGQVSLLNSIADPRTDFEINAIGTLNICELVRLYSPEAVLIYTSTNKVYGDLKEELVEEGKTRHFFKNMHFGIDETMALDFHG
ncbi:MAG: GDP-mannose 4,6-dehydratase, partial [Pseudomonadota bacterium]